MRSEYHVIIVLRYSHSTTMWLQYHVIGRQYSQQMSLVELVSGIRTIPNIPKNGNKNSARDGHDSWKFKIVSSLLNRE